MKARVILHIGPHKTGTTYLQKMLSENSEALNQLGVNYVSEGIEKGYGHHGIANEFISSGGSSTLEAAARRFSKWPVNIISSESFDRLNDHQVEAFASTLRDFDVMVVYVIRRVDDLILSDWQEAVKHGEARGWTEYFMPHVLRPMRSHLLNPSVVFDRYAHHFENRICILDYDRIVSAQQNIAAVFLKSIGIHADLTFTGLRINESLPYHMVELVRAINASWIVTGHGNPGVEVRTKFLEQQEKTASQSVTFLLDIISQGMQPVSFRHTHAFSHPMNLFRKKYAALLESQEPVDNSNRTVLLPTSAWLLHPDASRLVAEIVASLR